MKSNKPQPLVTFGFALSFSFMAYFEYRDHHYVPAAALLIVALVHLGLTAWFFRLWRQDLRRKREGSRT